MRVHALIMSATIFTAGITCLAQLPENVQQGIRELVNQGKIVEAIAKVDALLTATPMDADLVNLREELATLTPTAKPDTGSTAVTLAQLETIMEDYEAAKLAAMKTKLGTEFLERSAAYVNAHPNALQIWAYRALLALELGRCRDGWEAATALKRLNVEDTGTDAQKKLVARLDRRGWGSPTLAAVADEQFRRAWDAFVSKDFDVGRRHLEEAADAGSYTAMDLLGWMYLEGRYGLKVDNATGIKWLTKESKAGGAGGYFSLYYCHANGIGVPRHLAAAESFLSEANKSAVRQADSGDALALYVLGMLHRSGGGAPLNPKFALECMHKSAAKGYVPALIWIGNMHLSGEGTEKNVEEAHRWYQKASDAGHPNALARIAELYISGDGVPKNEVKAIECLRESLAKGNSHAALRLGIVYQGMATLQNRHEMALAYFRLAADVGHSRAMHWIGYMHLQGLGVAKNDAEAYRWFLKAVAANESDTGGLTRVANCLEHGIGTAPDLKQATKYYQRAAELGDQKASKWLSDRGLSKSP